MARRRKKLPFWAQLAGAALGMLDAMARIDNEKQKYRMQKAKLARERMRLKKDIIDAKVQLARLKEINQRTAEIKIRNQLNSLKLAAMEPGYAPGGSSAWQCPHCDTYYVNPAPNYRFCTNEGCNNQPLVQTVLNLN